MIEKSYSFDKSVKVDNNNTNNTKYEKKLTLRDHVIVGGGFPVELH